MFLKNDGQTADLKVTMDDAYKHICTCLVDLNGLKAALGTNASANYAFSSCSEHGQYEAILAR